MQKQMMKAAVLDRPLSIEVKDVPVPEPRPDEALVQVHCIGICGSDVHYYEHGRIGRYEVKQPIILGHEVAGTVVKVGSAVTNVAIGDRVAVEPGVTCGRCDYCKSGRYNLCPDVVFMATPPVDGAWADYVAVRSDFLFKLPEAMSFEEGALLEPLSVGIHAMTRGRVKPSDRVARPLDGAASLRRPAAPERSRIRSGWRSGAGGSSWSDCRRATRFRWIFRRWSTRSWTCTACSAMRIRTRRRFNCSAAVSTASARRLRTGFR